MTEVGDHHVIFYAVLDVGPSVCYRRKSPSSEYGLVGPVNMNWRVHVQISAKM